MPDISTNRLYAVGDVHGRADLLADILDWIDRHAAALSREPTVYLLGDIVDRGPDSRGALDLVAATLDRWPTSRLFLGNHDDWMLQFLAGGATGGDVYDNWMAQGGSQTLQSYGASPDRPEAARETILEGYSRHAALLREASILECNGAFAFVHAGIEPSKPFDAQERDTCLKIRAPFLNHVGRLAHVVVHGHSPQRSGRPTITENRISIDTGAFFSNVLTVVAIDEDRGTLEFAATDGPGRVGAVDPVRLDRGLGTAGCPVEQRAASATRGPRTP